MLGKFFRGLLFFVLAIELNIVFILPVIAAGSSSAAPSKIPANLAVSSQGTEDSFNAFAPTRINFSAGGGTEGRGIFSTDELIGLFYSKDKNTLWFINPKQNWQTPNAQEYNMGTGLRHIFNDKFILGLHYFYDKRLSKNDIWHNQNGVGLEFLSQPFDFRFNWYDPTQKGKGTTVSNYYKLGPQHLLQIGSQEEALGGYDFEFGAPVFEKQTKTRLYLGGFFFNSKIAKDINGFRTRTETNLTKWLAFDTTFNRWANGKTEVLADLRVTVPFELGRIKEKKNPFKVNEMDYIHDRIFERVVRDIDVKTNTTNIGDRQKEVPGVGIVYVDNTNNTGIEDGTLAHPYNTLDEALTDATGRYIGTGGTARYVYIFRGDGTARGMDLGNYTLVDNAVLWGSGYNGGYNGVPVLGYPVVDDTVSNIIVLGNNNTVMGLEITDGANGIFGSNISQATITHNFITGNGNGIYLENYGVNSGWNISGNKITLNTGSGIYLNNGDPIEETLLSNVNISGNEIKGNSHGVYIDNYMPISNVNITGNDISENGVLNSGIHIENYGDASNFNISGNLINGNTGPGVYLYNDINALADNFSISGNTISGNTGEGIRIENYDSTIHDFTFAGNTISGNDRGIYVKSEDQPSEGTSIYNFKFTGNSITDNNREGIYVKNKYGSIANNFAFTNNAITRNGYDGIRIWNDEASASGFTFANNTITGNYGAGIYLENNSGDGETELFGFPLPDGDSGFLYGMFNFNISDNIIMGNSGTRSGIDIYNDGFLEDFAISNNTISNNFGAGIDIYNSWGTFHNLTISNNTIADNFGSGIDIENYDDMGNVTISGNTISGNFPEPTCGIDIYSREAYTHDFTFSNNTISGNSGSGIDIYNYQSDVENFTFGLNQITGNTGSGIEVYNERSGASNFNFTGNIITGNGIPSEEGHFTLLTKIREGAGIYINNYHAGMHDFTFTGNNISNNYGDGFNLDNYHAGADNFLFSLNTVTNNTGNGLYFGMTEACTHNIDLGGGALESVGLNIIQGNQGEYDLINDTNDTIYAKGNLFLRSDRIYGDVVH